MSKPTAKELIATAEYLAVCGQPLAQQLAEYVLATVHADDDEPITDKWYDDLPAKARSLCYARQTATGDNIELRVLGEFSRLRTRGQVRKLCEMFGIAHDKTEMP